MSLAQLADDTRTIYFVNDVTLRQSVSPPRLLGRVNASSDLIVAGAGPVGALAGGVLGEWLGVRETLFIAALGPFIACVVLLYSPVRHLRAHTLAQAE